MLFTGVRSDFSQCKWSQGSLSACRVLSFLLAMIRMSCDMQQLNNVIKRAFEAAKSLQGWSQLVCPGQMARDQMVLLWCPGHMANCLYGMRLVWIPWHFLTGTKLVVGQVRWLQQQNAERSQNMPTSVKSTNLYQWPLKHCVLMVQRSQLLSRSLETEDRWMESIRLPDSASISCHSKRQCGISAGNLFIRMTLVLFLTYLFVFLFVVAVVTYCLFDLLVFLCALLYSFLCLLCINPLIVAIDGVIIKQCLHPKKCHCLFENLGEGPWHALKTE